MTDRLVKVKNLIARKGLDGIFVSRGANRRYLSGFTGSTGNLLITPDENIFITDFRYVEQAEQECTGFKIVKCSKDYTDALAELMESRSVKRMGFEDRDLSYFQYIRMKDRLEGVELVTLGEDLDRMRMVKDGEELECIAKAAEIADMGFEHILNHIGPGVREREVSLELEFFMRKQGISAPSFEFIVASGPRSALPHGIASDRRIEKGDLVTLDFGGVFHGYCSDMTRTVVVGQYTPRQKEIYDIVLEAQLQALEQIRPGMTGAEVDRIARDVIDNAGYGEYFGHGLGHGVGLLIHEAPVLSHKGDIVMEPGMVVTVEPGIYIPGFGGVRIEDLLVIKEDGIVNLTRSPKELIII